jgi:hypothetical protein
MTIADWMSTRTPLPPAALRERISFRLGTDANAPAEQARLVCTRAATRTISQLIAGGACARDQAIDLLAADALITYAIEAETTEAASLPVELDAMVRELSAIAGHG